MISFALMHLGRAYPETLALNHSTRRLTLPMMKIHRCMEHRAVARVRYYTKRL
jgi:hypothetical protein